MTVDVAFGGAFYAYLDAAQVGLEVTPEHLRDLVQAGHEIKHATMAAAEIVHPLEPELRGIYGTILAGPPATAAGHPAQRLRLRRPRGRPLPHRHRHRRAGGAAGRARTAGDGRGDRQRVDRRLGVRRPRAGRTTVGPYEAVVPEITGRAAIVGFDTWVVDPDDALGAGFFLR